jgi:hypothetical protein
MLETAPPHGAISPVMDATAAPDPNFDATLTELAALGMRAGRVVARMMEIEQAAAEIAASWLPERGHTAASLGEAVAAGKHSIRWRRRWRQPCRGSRCWRWHWTGCRARCGAAWH